MELSTTFLLFIAAFGASALGGVLGMASGIFIVPILTMFFGIDFHVAIGASLISVIACSCGSASSFLKERLTNVRLAIVLESATTFGALTGALLIGLIPTPFLYGLFAFILILSAQQMLAQRREVVSLVEKGQQDWGTTLQLHSSYPDAVLGKEIPYSVGRVPLGMFLMYFAGMMSALLGIGSGVLKIPAMDKALRLPIKVSSATSNFMIGVTAAASAAVYLARGDIDMNIAGPVALGSVVGALIGARLLIGISSEKLRIGFVIILGVLAVQMLMSALGIQV